MSERTIESMMNRSLSAGGYAEDFVALNAIHSWTNGSNAQLGAATEPDLVSLSGVFGVKWDHGGTTTDLLRGCFTVPLTYAKDRHGILLGFKARKVDSAGVDENADLKVQAVVTWHNPGDAAVQTVTVTSDALAAASAAADLSDFEAVELDIGAAIEDADAHVEPGALMTIDISPNEAVGTTDMDLQVVGQHVLIRRHASTWDRDLRSRVGQGL